MAKLSANGHREVARWRDERGAEYAVTTNDRQCRLLYKWAKGESWAQTRLYAAESGVVLGHVQRFYATPDRGYRRVK